MATLTCRDVIVEFLADYVDGRLAPAVAAELEAHLRECAACQAYLKTYRKTRDLIGSTSQVEMPAEMRDILRRVLTQEMRKTKG
jgi:anti-sigma factor RsiW